MQHLLACWGPCDREIWPEDVKPAWQTGKTRKKQETCSLQTSQYWPSVRYYAHKSFGLVGTCQAGTGNRRKEEECWDRVRLWGTCRHRFKANRWMLRSKFRRRCPTKQHGIAHNFSLTKVEAYIPLSTVHLPQVEFPLWMARPLAGKGMVDLDLPKHYTHR